MFGPNWDHPCPACTSLIDGFDRSWYQVSRDAAFAVVAKAPPQRINAWAKERGWSQIGLLSGYESTFEQDYKCQEDSDDDMQQAAMHVFARRDGQIFHFWAADGESKILDMVWPYWNLMDLTPEGRPDHVTPPQKFRSRFLEEHYLNRK